MSKIIVRSIRQFSLRKTFYQNHLLYDSASGESFNTPGNPMSLDEVKCLTEAINNGRQVVCNVEDGE